eukprot:718889-Prymnesium_polylepis.1
MASRRLAMELLLSGSSETPAASATPAEQGELAALLRAAEVAETEADEAAALLERVRVHAAMVAAQAVEARAAAK